MAPLKVAGLLATYELTPKMREQLKAAFDGLGSAGVAYTTGDGEVSVDRTRSLFGGQYRERKERVYRALHYYAAQTLNALFEQQGGKELHGLLMDVMSGSRHGILLRGLPEDVACKGLVIMGLKTLFADGEGVRHFVGSLPDVISRKPITTHMFHHDREKDHDHFLFMGSAQPNELSAPTLLKKAGQRDKNHLALHFKPDEMAVFNDRTLEHSTGLGEETSAARRLFRDDMDSAYFFRPIERSKRINGLMQKGDVPQEHGALKRWLTKELKKMETQRRGRG